MDRIYHMVFFIISDTEHLTGENVKVLTHIIEHKTKLPDYE